MATPFNRIAQVVRHPAAICRGKVFINGKVLVSNSPSSQLYTIVPPIVRSWTWVFRWAAMLVFRDEWDSWGLWIFATWLELSIFLGLESLISHPPSTCASWQVLRVIAPATFDIGATGLCCSLVGTFEVPMIGRPKANARFFFSQTTIVGIRLLVPSRKVHIWYVCLHIPFNAMSLDLVVPSTDVTKNLTQLKWCSQFMQVAGVGVNCEEQHVFAKNAGIWKQIWTLKYVSRGFCNSMLFVI